MKLLVIGNCQARPVAQILSRSPAFDPLEPIILHLADATQADTHQAQMDQADLILAQFTHPAFEPGHLAAEAVARDWPDKTLVWPNLFYSGQQPFLRYLTDPAYGRLFGPFEAVHDIRLLLEWHALRTGQPAPQGADRQAQVHQQSLATLRAREAGCDVIVSDLIETHHADRRLFFTFNHPSRWLLEALCRRVAAHAGVDLPAATDDKEPLGRVVVPSTWHQAGHPARQEGADQVFEGMQVTLQPGGRILAQGRQSYTPDSLRESAFRCFDHMAPHVDFAALRLTPRISGDPVPLLSDRA